MTHLVSLLIFRLANCYISTLVLMSTNMLRVMVFSDKVTGLSRQEGCIYGCRPPALSIGDLNFLRSRLAADEIMICKVIKL